MMKTLSAYLRNWRVLLVAGVAVIAAVAVMTGALGSVDRSDTSSRPVFEVAQGPLTISVSVSGTIKALDQEILTSEVEGQTTILYIIPEGTHVEKGDLLVKLDGSQLQDSLVDQEIRTQNTEAALVNATETFEVVKNQSQSDIDKAELTYRFAVEDLQKYKDGDYPLEIKAAEARVTVARGELKRAQEKLEGSRKLAEREFITPTQLEADEQAHLKSDLDLQMAEEELKLLNEFEYRRQIAQLESDVDQARMALERTKRKAAADIVQAEAELKAKKLEYEREKGKLEKLKQQIAKTEIYAPRSGLVIYGTTGQSSFRGNREPLAEGQTVRERQELIYLPTTDSYKAEVKVHESSLAKVKPGLPVVLTVEGVPGRTFEGVVETIAPLPDAQSVWMNPDLKVYNSDIRIQGNTEGLKTGMTCRGEILVKEFDETIYVPVQAVVREAGVPTVYVLNGSKVERREVALGLDNNMMVQIEKGLSPRELVLLAPPLAADDLKDRAATRRRNGGDTPSAGENGAEPAAESTSAPEAPAVPTVQADGPPAAPAEGQAPAEGPGAEGEGGRRSWGGGEGRGGMRDRFQNMSPEERERMREEFRQRMESMSPEEREQMRQRRRGGGEGGFGGAREGGDGPRGGGEMSEGGGEGPQ